MSVMSEYEVSKEIAPVDIPIEEIFADTSFNCRGAFGMTDVAELATDIQTNGLLQPIIVTPYDEDGYKFKVIAGHRRLMACQKLKRIKIPAVIKENVTDLQARAINLIENIQRKQLNMLQEAKGLQSLIDAGLRDCEIADYLGVTTGWTQPRLWLLDMPEAIQLEAAAGLLTANNIRELHRMPLHKDMLDAVVLIKEARNKGEKIDLTKKRKAATASATERKVRGITDLKALQTAIREAIGNGLSTRVIAWAIGEITDVEIYKSLKDEADAKGINYSIPENLSG